jgi:hypothetical protein
MMLLAPQRATPLHERDADKKGAAVTGGSRVYREASNRVDRSHSMSKEVGHA